MRVGIVLVGGDWPAVQQAAMIVDESTIDCLGFWDHFQPIGFNYAAVNGWATYGHLAALTRRVRFCPLVLDGPNYTLGRMAKETSMLGIVSNGRFELGIGIGDVPQEEVAWGLPPYADAATRITWLAETVAALRLVWQGEAVDFAGAHVQLQGAACRPAPPAPLRVVVGARPPETCLVPPSSAPPNTVTVQVYFTCDFAERPVPRYVPPPADTRMLLRAALAELVAGPTEAEQAAGFDSFFSADTATIITDVTLPEPTSAVVDVSATARTLNNASTSEGSRSLVAQLSRTLFQVPELETITFQMKGSCDAFWIWLERPCLPITRATYK